jgi:hypothetical protein
LQGSRGIYVAIVILLVYLLVALIHMAVFINGGWSSDTWNSELIALAVDSSPTEQLQNPCVGIEDPETWRRIVTARETTEAHVEIAFGEDWRRGVGVDEEMSVDEGSNDIEMNHGLGNDNNTLKTNFRRRVVPGKKYGALG